MAAGNPEKQRQVSIGRLFPVQVFVLLRCRPEHDAVFVPVMYRIQVGKPGLASCMYNRLVFTGMDFMFFKAPFLYLRVSATRNSSGPNREPYLLIRLLFFTIMAQNVAQFNCQTVLDDCSSLYVVFFFNRQKYLGLSGTLVFCSVLERLTQRFQIKTSADY